MQKPKKSLFNRHQVVDKENNLNDQRDSNINKILFEIDKEEAKKYNNSGGRMGLKGRYCDIEPLRCLQLPQMSARGPNNANP